MGAWRKCFAPRIRGPSIDISDGWRTTGSTECSFNASRWRSCTRTGERTTIGSSRACASPRARTGALRRFLRPHRPRGRALRRAARGLEAALWRALDTGRRALLAARRQAGARVVGAWVRRSRDLHGSGLAPARRRSDERSELRRLRAGDRRSDLLAHAGSGLRRGCERPRRARARHGRQPLDGREDPRSHRDATPRAPGVALGTSHGARARGKSFMPVVFPGFSWSNLFPAPHST
jgi:hypothetical protein